MSNLTLDGSISFIGNEFIKLLATGSSNLATEEYVDDAIEQNGGGGGNVDLSNYYTQTETDNLLNNKLNVNNPQDIIGTLRIDSTNGNGKLIVNAVGAPNDEDFYVNGLSNLGGTLKAQLIQASSNIETSQQIKSNTINTYSNSNMIIQRNAIPYITLDSQEVDDETVEKIILMKDVEFSGGLSLNTLSVDTLNTVGLNDMVFNINTLGEMLRLEVGGIVRVPNNRSFLSQNIFTDIIKPLTFSNDVVFNGGNNTNDAYEEYVRLDASAERVNFSKIIDVNEDVIVKQTKVLYLDATANLQRYITTRNDNGQDILELVNNKATNNQIRFTNNGSTSLIVDNSFVFSERQIQGNNGLKVDYIDTRNTNVDFQFRRSGATAITLKADNVVQFTGYLHINNISTPTDTDMAIRRNDIEFIRLYKDTSTSGEAIICSKQLQANGQIRVNNLQINQFLVGIQYTDFRLENANNSIMRFFVGNSTSPNLQISQYINGDSETINEIVLNRTTKCGGIFHTNTINSNDNNTLNIQQNNNTFISLFGDTLNRVQINRFLRVVDGGGSTQAHFVQSTNGNYMEIRLGNHINAYSSGTPVTGNTIHLNYYSHGNVFLGTNQDTSPDNPPTISINKFSSNTGNAFEVQGNSVFSGTVSTNTLNSETGDLVFQRNGTEIFKCETSAGIDNNDILNITPIGGGMSASNIYCNSFKNRTLTSDTVFYGANSAGDNRIEYMKWNRTDQSLDFNAPIDNTNIAVIGNIVDTTVSDERLKTNIQDVESNYCDCIKNVKIKTFEYKDEKYKDSDKYGFIAQHLQKHLPKEFDNIVKETKPKKDEGEAYLSINYMKLSVVLWGALQETLTKVEHLEASMYEMMEDIKELKGKKTTKPKAKAKSKTKAEK